MLSCSRAGTPPTSTVNPFGGVIDRSSVSFLAASLAWDRPFWITRTESFLGFVVLFGPGTHGLPASAGQARSCQFLSVNPEIEAASLRISPTCWSVTLLPLLLL